MAFVSNSSQQMSLTDSTHNLTDREKKFLEKSWAKTFADKIFPAIDENLFSVLNDAYQNGTLRKGLKALIDESGTNKNMTSMSAAFRIAPRINAAGRMGSANRAIKLLLTDDIEEATLLANEIGEANTERQSTESGITEFAEKYIEDHPEIMEKVVEYAKGLKPSKRGELEITDLNRIYLESGELNVELLGQGFTWLDTGTHESLVDATNFVKTVETHQHRKIACLEEIAYLNGWISKEEVFAVYEVLKKNQYGQYLKDVLDGKYQENLY